MTLAVALHYKARYCASEFCTSQDHMCLQLDTVELELSQSGSKAKVGMPHVAALPSPADSLLAGHTFVRPLQLTALMCCCTLRRRHQHCSLHLCMAAAASQCVWIPTPPLLQGLSDALRAAGRDLSAAHSAAAAKTGVLQCDLDAANAAVISLKVLRTPFHIAATMVTCPAAHGVGIQSARGDGRCCGAHEGAA